MATKLTDKQIQTGIFLSYALILLYCFQSFVSFSHLTQLDENIVKEILFHSLYLLIAIPIMLLIRQIVAEFPGLYKKIIPLIIIDSLTSVADLLMSWHLPVLVLSGIMPIAMMGIYLAFMISILLPKYNEHKKITLLRPFAISFIVVILATLGVGILLALFDPDISTGFIYSISAIPFIFLIGYFKKLVKFEKETQVEQSSKHWLDQNK